MKVLIIDNHDSFTYNLAELVAAAAGRDPLVLYNDAVQLRDVRAMEIDAVILSPGPGRPERERDFGVCGPILQELDIPVLGVCLGHQGIAHACGARISHAPEPMHGRLSRIAHTGTQLLKGVPSPFEAVRYHSLIASGLPEELVVDARTPDGLVMALHHTERPLWGVQFHPESVASEHGARIVSNFLSLAEARRTTARPGRPRATAGRSDKPTQTILTPVVQELPHGLSPEACFERLYGEAKTAFWLDSSSHARGQGRHSFMGDARGPLSETVSYDVTRRVVEVSSPAGRGHFEESIFDYLARRTREMVCHGAEEIPVPFKGGYAGYLGYELKADCGGRNTYQSPQADAQLVFADRFVAFDHETGRAWCIALAGEAGEAAARDWIGDAEARLGTPVPAPRTPHPPAAPAGGWTMRHSREAYLARIHAALSEIHEGESYEVCLCNEWRRPYDGDPLAAYQSLRKLNPAPYSAFLRFGGLSVLSCSPERMVQITGGGAVTCKPIKGTIARGETPEEDAALKDTLQASEKDRAENLMIVDLIRNDLNRVCRTGSVKVPSLYAIESFASVHQMVSTVTGELRTDESALSCVRSLFPGGSMTGAPKVRTMEIIDTLEAGPRGVYSGAIGYFSIDGAVDLSIVIRTAVLNGQEATIGAGGAIVALSDPDAEFAETMLKGELLRSALDARTPAAPAGAD